MKNVMPSNVDLGRIAAAVGPAGHIQHQSASCTECGGHVYVCFRCDRKARVGWKVPAPFGSLNAQDDITVCGWCWADLVNAIRIQLSLPTVNRTEFVHDATD